MGLSVVVKSDAAQTNTTLLDFLICVEETFSDFRFLANNRNMGTDPCGVDTSFSLVKYNEPVDPLFPMVSTLYHDPLDFDICLNVSFSDLLKSIMATDPGVDTSFSLVKYDEPVDPLAHGFNFV